MRHGVTVLLLTLFLLISIPASIADEDEFEHRNVRGELEAKRVLVDEEFLVFNGTSYYERVVDFNKTAMKGFGDNFTEYAKKYSIMSIDFKFSLVNNSQPFEKGDFVFVYHYNETMPTYPNASYYLNDIDGAIEGNKTSFIMNDGTWLIIHL